MKRTVSLTENHEFKRLYYKGRSAAGGSMAVYTRRGRSRTNRLGITVSTKLGCAVKRNRARRRLKEAYRLIEPRVIPGFDIVLVARTQSLTSPFERLKGEMLELLTRLGAAQ